MSMLTRNGATRSGNGSVAHHATADDTPAATDELPILRSSAEGDTVSLTGEVTLVHDDGRVTLRLHGFGPPITTGVEHLALVAKKKKPDPERWKKLFDRPD